jgi:hypothetical protein
MGGVAALWLPSVSDLDFASCQEKIGTLAFVLSNSENISCVAFLKHKNSRKQGTDTDAGRITTQLGTPRGRYDEHSSKSFPQYEIEVYRSSRKKPNFRR